MAFDTSRLVQQITLKGALPDGYFADQELLNIAYDVLLSEIVPLVLSKREEYYVREKDYSIVYNQTKYAIPARAMGGQLREVCVDDGNFKRHLERLDPRYADKRDVGLYYKFYLQNNDVVLYPTPKNTQDTLKLTYFFRPSKLVPVSETAQVTVINGSVLTLSSIPTGWTASNLFDITKGSGGYENLDFDLSVSAVDTNANTLTFVSTLPSTLAVGDWVSLAEESSWPYMPQEAQIALIQGSVAGCLESMGDPAYAVSAQKFEQQKAILEKMLSTRIEGQMKSFRTRVL